MRPQLSVIQCVSSCADHNRANATFKLYQYQFEGKTLTYAADSLDEMLIFLRKHPHQVTEMQRATVEDAYVLELPDGRELWQVQILDWALQRASEANAETEFSR